MQNDIHLKVPLPVGPVITMLLALPLAFIGISVYSSVLPLLGKLYHTNNTWIVATLCSYMLGFGLTLMTCHLYHVKKRYIAIALLVFTAIPPAIIATRQITVFISLRFVMGMLAALIYQAADNQRTRLLQQHDSLWPNLYAQIILNLAPIFAPLIGASLYHQHGPKGPILMLSAGAAIVWLFLMIFFQSSRTTIDSPPIWHPHTERLKQRDFLRAVLQYSLVMLTILNFTAFGSFILQDTYHLTPLTYSLLLSALSVSFLVGSIIGYRLPTERLARLEAPAVIAFLLCSLFLLLYYYLGPTDLFVFVLSNAIRFALTGLLLPYYAALGSAHAPGQNQLTQRTFIGAWLSTCAVFLFLFACFSFTQIMTYIGIGIAVNFALFAVTFIRPKRRQY